MELAPLTVLNKQYTIKRTLGDPGPFDVKYLGQNVDTKDQYVIREYFPAHLVKRESGKTSVEVKGGDDESQLFQSGLEYFQKESEVLSQLSHEALPTGYVTFEANGTFYRARPHRPSMSLSKGLANKGKLSEKAALTIMVPILAALQEAHENGLYHGGVSPDTIRLLEDGKVMLTGFRGAFIQLARQSGKLSDLAQPGTSAIEQFTPRGNQGPWTDVYAAAATICRMVTGEPLPEATERLEGEDPLTALIQDADAFSSPGVREALVDALTVDPSKRLQSAEALMNALKESSTRYDESEAAYSIIPVEPENTGDDAEEDDEEVEVLSTGQRSDRASKSTRRTSSGSKEKSSSNTGLMVGLVVALLLGGGGAYFVLSGGGGSGSYSEYRTRADSLYASEQYDAAERMYQQALDAREDDQYVLERLNQISELQSNSSARMYRRQMNRGDSLKSEADQLMAAGNMEEANREYARSMAAYFSALEAKPQDAEAETKIDQVETRQDAIADQFTSGGSSGGGLDLGQLASLFKQQGDRQLQDGNLQAALRQYRRAAEYSSDPGLNQAISDLETQIEEQEAARQFDRYFDEGMQSLRQQNYAAAKSALEQALDVNPENAEAQTALSRADSLLQVQSEQQAEYAEYRSQGDAAYQQGNYEEAIQAYQQALEYKPSDDYVEEQLEKARRDMEEIRLAQAKQKQEAERRENMVDEDGIYKVVDQEPRVEGGLAALHKRVNYPDQASRRGIEGRVYIQAIVNADGTVRDAEVARGIGGGCDREALRVVRSADFIPAKVDGKPVPARTTVWIEFALNT